MEKLKHRYQRMEKKMPPQPSQKGAEHLNYQMKQEGHVSDRAEQKRKN